jgi:hypothetical protein
MAWGFFCCYRRGCLFSFLLRRRGGVCLWRLGFWLLFLGCWPFFVLLSVY